MHTEGSKNCGQRRKWRLKHFLLYQHCISNVNVVFPGMFSKVVFLEIVKTPDLVINRKVTETAYEIYCISFKLCMIIE